MPSKYKFWLTPRVDFLNVELSEKFIEKALSKKKKFAFRHSPNFFAPKRCEKVVRTVTQFNFTIEKLTPEQQGEESL